MPSQSRPTLRRVKELLSYNPRTGSFRWRKKTQWTDPAKPVGGLKPSGYFYIQIDGLKTGGHRYAHLLMTGRWPHPETDHKDLNRSNNRWSNIREATNSQNKLNRKKKSNAFVTTLKGVIKDRRYPSLKKPYRAQINLNGKTIRLGYFGSELAAHRAYVREAKKIGGKYARAK